MFDLNVKSALFLIQEALPLLRKGGPGRNILVNSSISSQHPHHSLGVYAMTKAALENMVKWMCQELRDEDIRVNCISPGITKTAFAEPLWNTDAVPEKAKGEPENIAAVCATICAEKDGRFMNGEVYNVHGGFPKL